MAKKKMAGKKSRPSKKKTSKKSVSAAKAFKTTARRSTSTQPLKQAVPPKRKVPAKLTIPPQNVPAKKNAAAKQALPLKQAVQLPPRAPQRKIIGEGNKIIIVKPRSADVPADAPLSAVSSAVSSAAVPSVVPPLSTVPPQTAPVVKLPLPEEAPYKSEMRAWHELSDRIAPQIRLIMRAAHDECRKAAEWPFPFAKFMAALPQELCGNEMALLIAGLDLPLPAAARSCGIESLQARAASEHARVYLDERFAKMCGEMYRKYTAQLGGARQSADTVTERHLIPKIDRDFQLILGRVLYRAIAGEEEPVNEAAVG